MGLKFEAAGGTDEEGEVGGDEALVLVSGFVEGVDAAAGGVEGEVVAVGLGGPELVFGFVVLPPGVGFAEVGLGEAFEFLAVEE